MVRFPLKAVRLTIKAETGGQGELLAGLNIRMVFNINLECLHNRNN